MPRRFPASTPLAVLAGLLLLAALFQRDIPVALSARTAVYDPRFGAVEAYRERDLANQAGVRWSRLVFSWVAIQPNGPASWNQFYFPDDLLERELASGRRIAGLLIGTPAWAGDGSPTSVPRGLERPIEDSANLWASFARTMAERYKGRIDHWVIWNEPDIWDPASPLYTWRGSIEDFYRLQKVAYLAIKAANPSAEVSLPGLTYWWDAHYARPQYFARYLEAAARDPEAAQHAWYFDAAVLHLYNEPAGLYRAPMLYRQLLAARGLQQPIWINETNVAPWDDPQNPLPRADFRATLDEQASFLLQAFAWGLAGGAEHLSVYPFADGQTPRGAEQMGLVRADGSTRPAYQALQTVTRYLGGVQAARVIRDDDAVVIALEREGQTLAAAWAMVPRPVAVELPASTLTAVLVNKYGQRQPIAAGAGVYRLTLAPATANTVNGDPTTYLIGGDPVLLIEDRPGRR